MLQLEGAKRWRLHRCPSGPLPRSYCWDYDEKELGAEVEHGKTIKCPCFSVFSTILHGGLETFFSVLTPSHQWSFAMSRRAVDGAGLEGRRPAVFAAWYHSQGRSGGGRIVASFDHIHLPKAA